MSGPDFSTYAKNYDNRIDFDRVLLDFKIRTLLDQRPQLGTTLELGCATGLMSRALLPASTSLDIVDASSDYLEMTKKSLQEEFPDKTNALHFFNARFEDYKPDHPYDTIILSGVLPALTDPVGTLKLIATWLAPGGHIYITSHNALSLHRRLGKVMGLIADEHELSERDIRLFGHHKVYDPATLRSDVEAAGLSVAKAGSVFLKPFQNSLMEGLDPKVLEGLYDLAKTLPADMGAELYIFASLG